MEDRPKPESRFGKFDPIQVNAPRLFVSLNRRGKQRESEKLAVVYTPESEQGTQTFEFHGPDLLGVDDLRVLQGLIVVATEQYQEQAAKRLAPSKTGAAALNRHPSKLVVACSFSYLAKTIGYKSPDSGPTLRAIRESIERMSKVTIFFRESIEGRAVKLDSFITDYESDLSANGLRVGLNSRMTAAVLAVNKGEQYLKVHLSEVRRLRSDPARLIHHRLQYLKEGGSIKIRFKTLATYVWLATDSKNAMQKRMKAVKDALLELKDIGWTLVEQTDVDVRIRRPRSPYLDRSTTNDVAT